MNNRRSGSFRIPGYSENAALQLVAATGLFFIMFFASWVTMVVFGVPKDVAQSRVYLITGLAPITEYARYPWTILTYGLPHDGFWVWLSNAIWLYTFGSVIQSLVGFRQVIPIFVYGLLLGGLFCIGAQLIPGVSPMPFRLTGARSGILALVTAAVVIAPRYRFYLGENFGIPILIPAGIFLALSLLECHSFIPLFAHCAGGMLVGFLYAKALKNGNRPGAWMYDITGTFGRMFNPDIKRQNKATNEQRRIQDLKARRQAARDTSQRRVDEILDKINQRGYGSLTAEEREILVNASKETQG
jgi:membrane associated rhomboid family serine protease